MGAEAARISESILRLAGARGGGASICPSEVARELAEDWRPLLGPVRREAALLAKAGRIDILRKGKPVDPAGVKGVIRLRIREVEPAGSESEITPDAVASPNDEDDLAPKTPVLDELGG